MQAVPIMIFSSLKKRTATLTLIIAGLVLSVQPALAQETNQIAEAEGEMMLSLEGVVIDASTGMGMADVIVEISELDAKARTDQEGKFSFTKLIPGGNADEITIDVDHQGFKELSRRVNLLRTDDVVLRMKLKYPIE